MERSGKIYGEQILSDFALRCLPTAAGILRGFWLDESSVDSFHPPHPAPTRPQGLWLPFTFYHQVECCLLTILRLNTSEPIQILRVKMFLLNI